MELQKQSFCWIYYIVPKVKSSIKFYGFHGRVTEHLTIKVCIAVPKELKSKCKEFEPYELKANNDSIEYHYMTYETDGAKITKIDTTLNN